jgi:hypothetical protein
MGLKLGCLPRMTSNATHALPAVQYSAAEEAPSKEDVKAGVRGAAAEAGDAAKRTQRDALDALREGGALCVMRAACNLPRLNACCARQYCTAGLWSGVGKGWVAIVGFLYHMCRHIGPCAL